MEKVNIIVAPHPDDEIIGCYEILKDSTNTFIIYSPEIENERREESLKLKDFFQIKAQLFLNSPPPFAKNDNCILYVPDPVYEIHPLHRRIGAMYEGYARDGYDVIFYNTTMTAPYIHEVKNSKDKLQALDSVYFSQADLWKFDHKYFLFEGRCKWLF